MRNNHHDLASKYSEQDVRLDTDPDSKLWRSAPAIFLETDSFGRHVRNHRTEVRSRWTQNNLYFLFGCPYLELHLKPEPDRHKKTNGLWKWDVAETFIGSTRDPLHRYREFEVSPQGEWLDLDINLQKPDKVNDPAWSSGFEVAARICREEKIWYGSMRIPYAAIEAGEPEAGNGLRINFFRSQGPEPVELAWRPPLGESFHAPEQFGTLRFVR